MKKRLFHQVMGILISGSLVLTGQTAYAGERLQSQAAYDEETEYSSDMVYADQGFSYRLYYEDEGGRQLLLESVEQVCRNHRQR